VIIQKLHKLQKLSTKETSRKQNMTSIYYANQQTN